MENTDGKYIKCLLFQEVHSILQASIEINSRSI